MKKEAVRLIHVRKRIDRKFKFRNAPIRRSRGMGVLLAFLAIIVVVILVSKRSDPNTLAVVNGEPITIAELEQYRLQLMPQLRGLSQEQVLDQMINERVLLQEAARSGIHVDPEEIDAIITQALTQRGMTQDDLSRALTERQMDFTTLRETYRKQLIISRMLEQRIPVQVSQEQVFQFYTQYQQAFAERDPAEAQAEIQQLLAQQQRQLALPAVITELRNRSAIELPQR